MRINLAYYSSSNKNFYEPLSSAKCDKRIYDIVSSCCSDEYTLYEHGIYLCTKVLMPIPTQGWKIHVSAVPDNALQILAIVAKELNKQGVVFKVVKSLDVYIRTSYKPFSRSQFGKFITIYPKDKVEFLSLLERLCLLLEGFEGPEILTDRQYRTCKVLHYRYGGFLPREEMDYMGNVRFLIEDGNGRLIEDERNPYYSVPEGIEDIIDWQASTEIPRLFQEYTVERALRFTNSGGVYVGVQKATQRRVVIKEARPFTQLTPQGQDSVKFREREASILKTMQGASFLPELIDAYACSDHYFLIEEYIEGETLYDYILKHNAFLKLMDSQSTSQYIRKILQYTSELFFAIVSLQEHGFEMHDLTLDNVMISSTDEIKVIDMEGCSFAGGNEAVMGKNCYVMQGDPKNAGFKELGLLLFSCFVPQKEALLAYNENIISAFMNHIEALYDLPPELRELVFALIYPDKTTIARVSAIFQTLQTMPFDKLATRKAFLPPLIDLSDIQKGVQGVLQTHGKTKWSLFPITPMLHNHINYLCGLAGIASGLRQLGYTGFSDKFRAYCMEYPEQLPPGLYTGWGGCVWALLDCGETLLAEKLFSEHCTDVSKLEDASLLSGSAGLLLIAVKLHLLTQNQAYCDYALALADGIIESYSAEANEQIGLMNGSAGIALSMLAAFCLSSDTKYIAYGRKLLLDELKHSVTEGTHIGFPEKRGGSILYPYFARGTAGILSVVLRYIAVFPEFEAIACVLAEGIHYGFSVSPALLDGMAGIGNVFLDCAHILHEPKYEKLALEAAQFCLAHKIPYENDTIVFPDAYCQKISSDYGYGAMGILLFLYRCHTQEPVNFAIPLDLFIHDRLLHKKT